MYCDLNILSPKTKVNFAESQSELFELITSAICDNYAILAIADERKGVITDSGSRKKELYEDKNSVKNLYQKYSLKFLNSENNKLVNWDKIKLLSRLTIEVNEQKEMFQFSKPTEFINSYDILAVKPANDKMLESCLSGEPICDIIVLNLEEKFNFYGKKHLLTKAVESNVFFEVNYSKFITNNESRSNFISNFLTLMDIIKGKNIILNSGAENFFNHRSPFDIETIFETIFEVKHHIVKPMLSENNQKVVLKSVQRKYYKTAVNVTLNDKMEVEK